MARRRRLPVFGYPPHGLAVMHVLQDGIPSQVIQLAFKLDNPPPKAKRGPE
jgi:hypothetical protein